MTTAHDIDLRQLVEDRLTGASPDLLRELLTMFIHALMSAEADALCGAGYGQRSDERVNVRNGYRHRDFDTRVGTLDVAIPKLRQGSYFPDWLLQRRKRAERALTSVVATCYLLGVSTRRMEKPIKSPSKRMADSSCRREKLSHHFPPPRPRSSATAAFQDGNVGIANPVSGYTKCALGSKQREKPLPRHLEQSNLNSPITRSYVKYQALYGRSPHIVQIRVTERPPTRGRRT